MQVHGRRVLGKLRYWEWRRRLVSDRFWSSERGDQVMSWDELVAAVGGLYGDRRILKGE